MAGVFNFAAAHVTLLSSPWPIAILSTVRCGGHALLQLGLGDRPPSFSENSSHPKGTQGAWQLRCFLGKELRKIVAWKLCIVCGLFTTSIRQLGLGSFSCPYQSLFGISALPDLSRRQIPDRSIKESLLHQMQQPRTTFILFRLGFLLRDDLLQLHLLLDPLGFLDGVRDRRVDQWSDRGRQVGGFHTERDGKVVDLGLDVGA